MDNDDFFCPIMKKDTNDWKNWEQLVLYKLDELTSDVKDLRNEVLKLSVETAICKSRLTYLGRVAAALPPVAALAYFLIEKFS